MKKIYLLKTIGLLCALVAGSVSGRAETTYEQLTSISSIDESAQYVLGIDGTGFHYGGTSSWGNTALPTAQTPIYYTLTKASDGKSFTAKATISGTTYYLQIPTTNTFSMATSTGTNTDIIIGTTKVEGTNYAVANKTTTARHLRINGASGLRSYATETGNMAFFYKVVNFTLNAESNNSTYGTVSVDGNKITATPANGYRVSTTTPYEVTSGEATVAQNGNEFTVTASANCTVQINFEPIPTYAVTIETPNGGSLVVKNGDATVSSGEKLAVGTVLTITATPDAAYNFRNWQAVDGSTHTYTASNSGNYTMKEHAVTFKANFDAKVYHSVTWMVNGSIKSSDNYEEGDDIDFPSGIADIEGKSFVGWVNAEISGATVVAPTFITSATMETSDLTYYAVFADKTQGTSNTIIDEITNTTTEVGSSTSYSSWENKKSKSNAIYAGNTAGESYTIQMRSKENSGIISTTSGGKITKVVVSWNNKTTSGRTLDIYGKNSSYSSASDLYNDSKQGTKLGSIIYGTSTELTVEGNYTYIGLRSNSGAMYLSNISITWVSGTPDTYSGYCTTIPTATITLNPACTDGSMVYGTYSNSSAFVVSDDIVVSEVGVTDDKLVVKEYETGAVVPANTGVLVSALKGGDYDYTVTLSSKTGTSVLGTANLLRATGEGITAEQMAAADAKCLYYRLTMQNGETIGFWWGAKDGAAFAVGANKAYLAVPKTENARMSFWMGNEGSGIADMVLPAKKSNSAIYDLQGRRVANAAKGLYIVEGKKVLVK